MPSTRPASLRSTSKPLCDSSTTTSAPFRARRRQRFAAGSSSRMPNDHCGHHPARIGDRRVGKRLADHGDADAALLEHARGVKHRLLEVGIANVAGQKRHARRARLIAGRRTARLTRSRAQRELPMPGGRLDAQRLHHRDHVAALGLQRRVRALQRIAAIEQQHALGAALGPDRVDERRHAIHAADAAVGLGQRLEVGRGQHVGLERRGRDAERGQEILSDKVRQLASRLAHAEVDAKARESRPA